MTAVRLIAALLVLGTLSGVVAQSATVEEQVVGEPNLEFFSPNSEFEPRQEATLRLFVSNDGDILKSGPDRFQSRVMTARATTIHVRSGGAPVDVNTDRLPVGDVPSGTSGPFEISLTVNENAQPGRYSLPVNVRYTYTRIVTYNPTDPTAQPEFADVTVEDTRYLTVHIRRTARFDVVESRSDVLVGDRGNLTLLVENVGSEVARDASVSLSSRSKEVTFGTGSPSAVAFVGPWEPGETKRVEYDVALSGDANPRPYTLDATVTYKNADGLQREYTGLTTSVVPRDEQTFSLSDVESDLRVGEDGRVTGAVVNDGPGAVTDPVVTFETSSPSFEIEESEVALPGLDSGERAPFAFDVEVSDAADAGDRQLSFVVRYQNAAGETRQSDPLQARVSVAGQRDDFRVRVANGTVAAGSTDRLALRVTNNRNETVSDVSAKLFVNDPLASDDDEAFVQSLEPGETAPITLGVTASDSATPKVYPASIDFQYETPDGDTRISETYRVPVTVTEPADRGLPFAQVGGAVVLLGGLVAAILIRRR